MSHGNNVYRNKLDATCKSIISEIVSENVKGKPDYEVNRITNTLHSQVMNGVYQSGTQYLASLCRATKNNNMPFVEKEIKKWLAGRSWKAASVTGNNERKECFYTVSFSLQNEQTEPKPALVRESEEKEDKIPYLKCSFAI
jgi:hypothetical protein